MKNKSCGRMARLLLIGFLLGPQLILAQEPKPRPVEPIRVAIVTRAENSDVDRELHESFRAELNKRRDVAIGSRKSEWRLYLGIAEVRLDGKLRGYAGSLMVMDKDGEIYWLTVKTRSTVERLAQAFAASLEEEVFARLRR